MADFEQKQLNYAAEYSKDLANAYPYLSYFSEVWASPNSAKYRASLDNAKTVFTLKFAAITDIRGATSMRQGR